MQENLFIFSLTWCYFWVLWSKHLDNMMQLVEAFFNYFELQKFLFTFFQVHKSIETTLRWQKKLHCKIPCNILRKSSTGWYQMTICERWQHLLFCSYDKTCKKLAIGIFKAPFCLPAQLAPRLLVGKQCSYTKTNLLHVWKATVFFFCTYVVYNFCPKRAVIYYSAKTCPSGMYVCIVHTTSGQWSIATQS